MPRAQWSEFTGFAMTEFDSNGQQVGQNSLSYSSGRQRLAVPAGLRRRAMAVELFPAFARADGAHPWRATVRFRFLLAREQSVGNAMDLSVVPGGRTMFELPALPALAVPDGFAPFVEVRVRSPRAPATSAVRRVLTEPR
jgi:hypothetical protein